MASEARGGAIDRGSGAPEPAVRALHVGAAIKAKGSALQKPSGACVVGIEGAKASLADSATC